MAGTFPRKFPTPVLKPMWPFFAAGVVVMYGVSSFASVLSNTDEFKNDPRNPNAKSPKPADKH